MPQMMPMYWILTMLFTLITLMLIIINLYFFKPSHIPLPKKTTPSKKMNWIWKW